MKYLIGGPELIAKLQGLRKTLVKKGIKKGSRAGCKVIQARAKELVPVKSGALKKEIKVRALPRSRRWIGTQVTAKVAGGVAYYGAFVELGTKHAAARGFIKRAVGEMKSQAEAAFLAGIVAEIEKVAK